jgi:hypothetical protein
MSTTEGRRERIERILKLLKKRPLLNAHEIAKQTNLLTEITMDRLHRYLSELTWADMLINVNNRYTLGMEISMAPSKTRVREREREREKERKKCREREIKRKRI